METGKRSSILKLSKHPNVTTHENDEDEAASPAPTPRKQPRISMRRVSFASSNTVKEFAACPETVTIWNTTYEETIDKSDSNLTTSSQNMELTLFNQTLLLNTTRTNKTVYDDNMELDVTGNISSPIVSEHKTSTSDKSMDLTLPYDTPIKTVIESNNMEFTTFLPNNYDKIEDQSLNNKENIPSDASRPVTIASGNRSTSESVLVDNIENVVTKLPKIKITCRNRLKQTHSNITTEFASDISMVNFKKCASSTIIGNTSAQTSVSAENGKNCLMSNSTLNVTGDVNKVVPYLNLNSINETTVDKSGQVLSETNKTLPTIESIYLPNRSEKTFDNAVSLGDCSIGKHIDASNICTGVVDDQLQGGPIRHVSGSVEQTDTNCLISGSILNITKDSNTTVPYLNFKDTVNDLSIDKSNQLLSVTNKTFPAIESIYVHNCSEQTDDNVVSFIDSGNDKHTDVLNVCTNTAENEPVVDVKSVQMNNLEETNKTCLIPDNILNVTKCVTVPELKCKDGDERDTTSKTFSIIEESLHNSNEKTGDAVGDRIISKHVNTDCSEAVGDELPIHSERANVVENSDRKIDRIDDSLMMLNFSSVGGLQSKFKTDSNVIVECQNDLEQCKEQNPVNFQANFENFIRFKPPLNVSHTRSPSDQLQDTSHQTSSNESPAPLPKAMPEGSGIESLLDLTNSVSAVQSEAFLTNRREAEFDIKGLSHTQVSLKMQDISNNDPMNITMNTNINIFYREPQDLLNVGIDTTVPFTNDMLQKQSLSTSINLKTEEIHLNNEVDKFVMSEIDSSLQRDFALPIVDRSKACEFDVQRTPSKNSAPLGNELTPSNNEVSVDSILKAESDRRLEIGSPVQNQSCSKGTASQNGPSVNIETYTNENVSQITAFPNQACTSAHNTNTPLGIGLRGKNQTCTEDVVVENNTTTKENVSQIVSSYADSNLKDNIDPFVKIELPANQTNLFLDVISADSVFKHEIDTLMEIASSAKKHTHSKENVSQISNPIHADPISENKTDTFMEIGSPIKNQTYTGNVSQINLSRKQPRAGAILNDKIDTSMEIASCIKKQACTRDIAGENYSATENHTDISQIDLCRKQARTDSNLKDKKGLPANQTYTKQNVSQMNLFPDPICTDSIYKHTDTLMEIASPARNQTYSKETVSQISSTSDQARAFVKNQTYTDKNVSQINLPHKQAHADSILKDKTDTSMKIVSSIKNQICTRDIVVENYSYVENRTDTKENVSQINLCRKQIRTDSNLTDKIDPLIAIELPANQMYTNQIVSQIHLSPDPIRTDSIFKHKTDTPMEIALPARNRTYSKETVSQISSTSNQACQDSITKNKTDTFMEIENSVKNQRYTNENVSHSPKQAHTDSVLKDKTDVSMEIGSPVKNQTYTKVAAAQNCSSVENQTYTKANVSQINSSVKNRTYTKERTSQSRLPVRNETYTKDVSQIEKSITVPENRTYTKETTIANAEKCHNEDNEFSFLKQLNIPKAADLSCWSKNRSVKPNETTLGDISEYNMLSMSSFNAHTEPEGKRQLYFDTPKRSVSPYHMNFMGISPGIDDTQHLINLNLDKQKFSDAHPKSDFSKIVAGETPVCISKGFMALGDFSSNAFPTSLENTREQEHYSMDEQQLQYEIKQLTNSFTPDDKPNNISDESLELCSTIDETFAPIATATQYVVSTGTSMGNTYNDSDSEEYACESIVPQIEDFKVRMKQYNTRMANACVKVNKWRTRVLEDVKSKIRMVQNLPNTHVAGSLSCSDLSLDSSLENMEDEPLTMDVSFGIVPEKTVTMKEKIEDKQKSSKYWNIVNIQKNELKLDTLYKTIQLHICFDEETGIVHKIDKTYRLSEASNWQAFFILELFKEALSPTSVESRVGERYDVLSFIDYIIITIGKMINILKEFDKLEDRFSFKIDRSLRSATFKAITLERLRCWNISLNISNLNSMTPDCVSAFAKAGDIDETRIKNLVKDCRQGTEFFRDFMYKVDLLSKK